MYIFSIGIETIFPKQNRGKHCFVFFKQSNVSGSLRIPSQPCPWNLFILVAVELAMKQFVRGRCHRTYFFRQQVMSE